MSREKTPSYGFCQGIICALLEVYGILPEIYIYYAH
jgi:hypothetical protein